MATTNLGAAVVTYPATVWAGNRPTVRITGGTSGAQVTMTDGTLTERRTLDAAGAARFDLYPFIASRVTAGDICGTWAATHGTLSVTLATGQDTAAVSVVWVWGALGVGETAPTERTITYNAAYPMTLDTLGGRYDVAELTDGDTVDGVTVHIIEDGCQAGIYLRWLNARGETCYRRLERMSTTDEVTRKTIAALPLTDTADYSGGYSRGDGVLEDVALRRTVKLGAPYQREAQVAELLTLLAAARCDMYMGDGNWCEVQVLAGNATPTTATLQEFTLTIAVPTAQPQQP